MNSNTKKYGMGGAVQSLSTPMLAQGMQGGLSGFGTSGFGTFADGGILSQEEMDKLSSIANKHKMADGGQMSEIERILAKYKAMESSKTKEDAKSTKKEDKTSEFLRKSWEGKNIDDYVMYSDKYKRGGKMAKGGTFENGGGLEDAKIYVADLAEYNNGRLVGKWLDLSDYSSGAEVMEAIQEMLDEQTKKDKYGDVHEEYAIHDFEGFPRSFYSEYMGESDFDALYEMMKVADSSNLPIEVLMEAVSDLGYEDEPERVAEAYYSSVPASMGNEWRDFAYEYIDSIGNITEAVSKPEYYFDFESFGSDVRMDYTDEGLEEMGYNDLSDEELGEQMADEMGGVKNLGEKLIETYFDYDKFGRELEYDFISVRGKDGSYYFFNRNFAKGGQFKAKNFRKIESKGKVSKLPQEKWKVMVVNPYAKKDESVYFNVSAKNKAEAEKFAKSLYSKKYNVPTTKLLIEVALPYSHLNRFQIKNQYEGKTPKEIWNAMSYRQKEHFLHDHKNVCELTEEEIQELYGLNWDELNDSPLKNNTIQAFTEHIHEGQYAKGGKVAKSYVFGDESYSYSNTFGVDQKDFVKLVDVYHTTNPLRQMDRIVERLTYREFENKYGADVLDAVMNYIHETHESHEKYAKGGQTKGVEWVVNFISEVDRGDYVTKYVIAKSESEAVNKGFMEISDDGEESDNYQLDSVYKLSSVKFAKGGEVVNNYEIRIMSDRKENGVVYERIQNFYNVSAKNVDEAKEKAKKMWAKGDPYVTKYFHIIEVLTIEEARLKYPSTRKSKMAQGGTTKRIKRKVC
jgi:antirestriction protein